MAYRLEFTETFEKDLDSILDYMISKLKNPTAAATFYGSVKNTFGKVVHFPEMYPLHPLKRLSDKGYHFCPIGNFLAFYTIDSEQQIIYARAIVYGPMDLNKTPE